MGTHACPLNSWYTYAAMTVGEDFELRLPNPIWVGLDRGTFFGLLAGAAATALKPDVLYFATPIVLSMGLGLLWGFIRKRSYV